MGLKIKLGVDYLAKIGVLGGGSWGTSLAILLSKNGHEVDMWLRNKEQLEDIIKTGENRKYLPGIKFPPKLNLYNDIEKTLDKKDIVLMSIPTHGVRETLKSISNCILKDQLIVNVAKGIENDSLYRISEIVKEILPDNKYVVLSGPSHAEEVGLDIPTAVVSASEDLKLAEYVQDIFSTPTFRVYTSEDIIGVELGGALKNIIALGAGISDGVGYGDNSKAALMTRGINEITRLGVKMGANPQTFAGLSGIGDLIVTCTSMHSRNRRAGILIGEGKSMDEAIKEVGMVVEGILTTKSAYMLSKKYEVEMPITSELYNVLYKGKDVKKAVINLMGRKKKQEIKEEFY